MKSLLAFQAQAIKADLSAVEAKVERSVALLKSLGGERERWDGSSDSFKSQMATIIGDVLLTSAFQAYAGYFDQHMRQNLFATWSTHLQQAHIVFKGDLARIEVSRRVYIIVNIWSWEGFAMLSWWQVSWSYLHNVLPEHVPSQVKYVWIRPPPFTKHPFLRIMQSIGQITPIIMAYTRKRSRRKVSQNQQWTARHSIPPNIGIFPNLTTSFWGLNL